MRAGRLAVRALAACLPLLAGCSLVLDFDEGEPTDASTGMDGGEGRDGSGADGGTMGSDAARDGSIVDAGADGTLPTPDGGPASCVTECGAPNCGAGEASIGDTTTTDMYETGLVDVEMCLAACTPPGMPDCTTEVANTGAGPISYTRDFIPDPGACYRVQLNAGGVTQVDCAARAPPSTP